MIMVLEVFNILDVDNLPLNDDEEGTFDIDEATFSESDDEHLPEEEDDDDIDGDIDDYIPHISNEEEKELTNKFLRGELTFTEYAALMDGNEDEIAPDTKKSNLSLPNKEKKRTDKTTTDGNTTPQKRFRRSLPPALMGLMGEANLRYARGERDLAVQMCLEIIRQVPTAPEPFETLAVLYEELGAPDKSLQFALIAAHLRPKDVDQWIRLAVMSEEQENIKQAITCYSKAIKADPHNIDLHLKRASLIELTGEKKIALIRYMKLLEIVSAEKGALVLDIAKMVAHKFHEDNELGKAKDAMEIAFKKNPDEAGDLYLDVAEAFMAVSKYENALQLLNPLVESSNYSLAAVWLRQAECLKACNQLPEAANAYRVVISLAPQHLEARIVLSGLLKELGEWDEALAVLEQDPNAEILDPKLLYERCLLLKNSGRIDDFLAIGQLLLSRHCVSIRHRDEMGALTRQRRFSKKAEALKEIRTSRGESNMDVDAPNFGDLKTDTPSTEQEYQLLRDLCETCLKHEKLDLMQRLAFSALGSKRFHSDLNKIREIEFICLLACLYNEDAFYGYNLARDHLTRDLKLKRNWNIFNLIIQRADDVRHNRFIMRLLFRNPNHQALSILHANNCLVSGTYKYALSEYVAAFSREEGPMLAFLVAVTLFQMACQKFSAKKHSLVNQGLAFMWKYQQLRGKEGFQESCYNIGRAFHQLGLLPAAIHQYKQALEFTCPLIEKHPKILDLRREPQVFLEETKSEMVLKFIRLHLLFLEELDSEMVLLSMDDCKDFIVSHFMLDYCNHDRKRGIQNSVQRPVPSLDYARRLQETEPETDDSFYPVLRLLLPQLDRERGPYGVKEHNLAKVYIRILCLPKDGRDAEKLLNFRAPKSAGAQSGDFADVAYWVLKSRCPEGSKLTVQQVNAHLDNIAIKHALHEPRGVDDELIALLRAMSASDQKWLIRMLLKDMKLGIGHSKILETFHPDARELYDVTNNLAKVCLLLKDPSRRLHEVEVSVFSPFRPMLAEKCDIKNVEESMKRGQVYYVETKHDGERFQLHMQDGIYKYFSRGKLFNHPLAPYLFLSYRNTCCWDLLILHCDTSCFRDILLSHHNTRCRDHLMFHCDTCCRDLLMSHRDTRCRDLPANLFPTTIHMIRKSVALHISHSPLMCTGRIKLRSGDWVVMINFLQVAAITSLSSGSIVRNGYDYTDTFGSSALIGVLTPHVARLLRHDVKSCILDGEMMGWNTRLKCYKMKGINFDVKSLKLGDVHQPCFCVFDVLYLNGQVLTNKPLRDRMRALQGMFTPEEGILAYTDRLEITTGPQVMEELNAAIDRRLEGIVLKDPGSVYKPNTRKGGWYKIKPEF
uniref:ATP-dependent DNA ligase family profile domain-containing protein n=1 Tax=Timema shepardi TaxID=629360 RepID=A0A7R9AUQ7_TIMSH|nr:unnamed protein product [Timema shepardi]